MSAKTYINTGCMVGQNRSCNEPATHLIAAVVVADNGWSTHPDELRPGGVIALCEFHATTPVTEWDKRCAAVDEHGLGRCILDGDHQPANRHAWEEVSGPPGPPQRWQTAGGVS